MSDDKMVNNGDDNGGDDGGLTNNNRTKTAVNCHDRVEASRLFDLSYL